MKKIISILLCAVLMSASAICANAAEKVTEYDGFYDTGEQVVIADNTVKLFSYGIDNNTYKTSARFVEKSSGNILGAEFKNTDSTPKTIALTHGETYQRRVANAGSGQYRYKFDNTGGKYRKVRVKLSAFDDYFNEDGSCTKEVGISSGVYHDYKFRYEDMGKNMYYNSELIVISGGAYTAVTPDKNGEVEFYVCTDVGVITEYVTNFTYSTATVVGGGGGTTGKYIRELTYGDVDGSRTVDVDDVTYLQMYISGLKDVNALSYFHSDTNSDTAIDVDDVTHLQFGIAGIQ